MRLVRLLTALTLAVLLSPAAAAHGANIATPRMVEVASWAAGKPLQVHCEDDWEVWERMTLNAGFASPPGGYTYLEHPMIYLSPPYCRMLNAGPDRLGFGRGMMALLHESFHQRWLSRDEARVECGARVMIYETLRLFYDIPFFSEQMYGIVNEALAHSLAKSAPYQGGCYRL